MVRAQRVLAAPGVWPWRWAACSWLEYLLLGRGCQLAGHDRRMGQPPNGWLTLALEVAGSGKHG